MSQGTVTDSMLALRERVKEKRTRALMRLRAWVRIIMVWKLSVKKPVVKRFQKAVRRAIYGYRMYKHMIRNRRYPCISNPRASKAIYRLMMLVRMKLRVTAGMGWREKWKTARRKLKGILNIQAIVASERKQRIDMMYEPESIEGESMSEYDEVNDLEPVRQNQTSKFAQVKQVSSLIGDIRGSAVSAKAQQ